MNWKTLLDPKMKNPNVAGATPNHLPQQMNKLDAMVHVLAQRVTRLEMAMGQVVSQKGITVRV